MKKELICICCPRGCHLEIDTDSKEVTGNFCPRGKTYAINELTCPKRTLTTTMLVTNGDLNVVSVRTDKEIDKSLLFEAMKIIDSTKVEAPINEGQILISNILNTGVNIIATKEIKKHG